MIGLKLTRSTASGFLGIRMVLASYRYFGSLSHYIIKVRILTRTLTGTARSCLDVRPSDLGAIDKSSLGAFISSGVTGSQIVSEGFHSLPRKLSPIPFRMVSSTVHTSSSRSSLSPLRVQIFLLSDLPPC